MAAKIVASLDKVYRDKHVATVIEVDGKTDFRGDEGDLTKLLGNLTDNAYKWCAKAVRIGAQVRDGRITIVVEDDGPGIGTAGAQLILESGVRADQAVPGHGIGLAIVHDIVNAYEGDIVIGKSGLGGAAVRIQHPEPFLSCRDFACEAVRVTLKNVEQPIRRGPARSSGVGAYFLCKIALPTFTSTWRAAIELCCWAVPC